MTRALRQSESRRKPVSGHCWASDSEPRLSRRGRLGRPDSARDSALGTRLTRHAGVSSSVQIRVTCTDSEGHCDWHGAGDSVTQ